MSFCSSSFLTQHSTVFQRLILSWFTTSEVSSLVIQSEKEKPWYEDMSSSVIHGNCEIYSEWWMEMNYSLRWTLKLTLLSLTLRDSVLNFHHLTKCPLSSKLKWVRISRNCCLYIPALRHAYILQQEIMLSHNFSPSFVECLSCDLWHW